MVEFEKRIQIWGEDLVNNMQETIPHFLGFPHLSRMRGYVGNYLQLLYLWLSMYLPECPARSISHPGVAGSSPVGGANEFKGLWELVSHIFLKNPSVRFTSRQIHGSLCYYYIFRIIRL
jgi:hypothetical protein